MLDEKFYKYFRSTCPSWLLVAAKASGLFEEYQVRNVTCVLYPKDAYGGEIVVFEDGKRGEAFPVDAGTSAIFDADSMFHLVAQIRSKDQPREKLEVISGPAFPSQCKLQVTFDCKEFYSNECILYSFLRLQVVKIIIMFGQWKI